MLSELEGRASAEDGVYLKLVMVWEYLWACIVVGPGALNVVDVTEVGAYLK